MKINVSYPAQIERSPRDTFDHARALMREGKPKKAITALEALLEQMPEDPPEEEIRSTLGVAYAMKGRFAEAIEMLRLAITANPDFTKAYHNLCLTYTRAGALEEAIACGNDALARGLEEADICVALSNAYRRMGDLDRAISIMEKAINQRPEDPLLWNNYGSWLFEAGRKDEAHDCFTKALALNPDYTPAHRMLSQVHKYREDSDPHFKQLLGLADKEGLDLTQTVHLHFALGKAYEDVKDYEAAFAHYKIGNDANRQGYEYDPAIDRAFADQLKEAVPDEESWKARALSDDGAQPTPIFIVGMPRSGTSLVEQILASHSEVFGAGELRELDILQFNTFGLRHLDYAEMWGVLSQDDLEKMAGLYRENLAKLADGERYVSDKMPMNFIFLGAIAQLFPSAKIIHCRRDPQAICLSIYKNLFSGHMKFGYEQKELAAYYRMYEDLMKHWHAVMPGQIYDVVYEDLTDEPRGEIEKLLAYCDLEWQDACMDFHKTKRAVTTASAMQVRKPIYKDSIAGWKHFEPYLDREILELGS